MPNARAAHAEFVTIATQRFKKQCKVELDDVLDRFAEVSGVLMAEARARYGGMVKDLFRLFAEASKGAVDPAADLAVVSAARATMQKQGSALTSALEKTGAELGLGASHG